MITLADLAPYIGIPFQPHGRDASGCDCWGLVVLVYRSVLGIELPGFTEVYQTTDDCTAIGEAMTTGRQAWQQVETSNWYMLDVVLFRRQGHVAHCGLLVGDGLMLHSTRGVGSQLTRITTGQWAPRLEGVYRYV